MASESCHTTWCVSVNSLDAEKEMERGRSSSSVGLSSNISILSSKLLGIVVAVLGMIMLIAALFHERLTRFLTHGSPCSSDIMSSKTTLNEEKRYEHYRGNPYRA